MHRYLVVLCDKTRLKCWEEQRSGSASKDSANHKNFVLGPGRVLGDAAEDVADAVGDTRPHPSPDHPKSIILVAISTKTQRNQLNSPEGAHSLLIHEGSDDGAEEHGGTEAGDEGRGRIRVRRPRRICRTRRSGATPNAKDIATVGSATEEARAAVRTP
jgi:hypothetical protein